MKRRSSLLAKNFKNTFLSCEKDQEKIWRKLLVESKPYSDQLKRLLVVNTPDCLDESQEQYNLLIDKHDLATLRKKGYLRVVPKIGLGEHQEVMSYVLLEFDDFFSSENPEFRDCVISFTIICNLDQWELDDYKLRPHQIAGYIDGILNESRLSGIGTLQFIGASQIVLNEELGGIILRYSATHGRGFDEHGEASITNRWPAANTDYGVVQ